MPASRRRADAEPDAGPPRGEAGAAPATTAKDPPAPATGGKRGDRPPREVSGDQAAAQSAERKAARERRETARYTALETAVAEVLAAPAVPAAMLTPITGDTFLVHHFANTAEVTAARLVAASKTSPPLRRALERMTTGGGMFMAGLALAGYVIPPSLYAVAIATGGDRLKSYSQAISFAATMDEHGLAELTSRVVADASAQTRPPNGTPPAAPGAPPADAEPGAAAGTPDAGPATG